MKDVYCKCDVFPSSLRINTLINKVPHHKPCGKLPKVLQPGWQPLGTSLPPYSSTAPLCFPNRLNNNADLGIVYYCLQGMT